MLSKSQRWAGYCIRSKNANQNNYTFCELSYILCTEDLFYCQNAWPIYHVAYFYKILWTFVKSIIELANQSNSQLWTVAHSRATMTLTKHLRIKCSSLKYAKWWLHEAMVDWEWCTFYNPEIFCYDDSYWAGTLTFSWSILSGLSVMLVHLVF